MATRTNAAGDDGRAQLTGWRRVLGCLTLVVVGLGVVGGAALIFLANTGYVPFLSMTTAWEAPYDRNASDQGNGAWLAGDTVVRSRYDAVTGFDVTTGEKRWEYVPGRADICSVSSTADDSAALLVHGEPGKDCSTVAALDLTNGRELWHTSRAPAVGDTTADRVATGAGLGVFLDGDTPVVRAVDLRSGTPRWTAAVPRDCVPGSVAAADKQVLAVVACGDELKLAAFDPADGGELWTAPLDARRGVPTSRGATFLSADPAVVRVGEPEGDGSYSYLTFGPDGRPQGRIDEVGGHGDIKQATVAGGRLLAIATYVGNQSAEWERLVAFDLTSGNEVWREHVAPGGTDVAGLYAAGDRVTVMTSSPKYGDTLYVYDAATGDEEDDRAFRDDPAPGYSTLDGLFTYEDLVIAFRHGQGVRPFSVYERW
ncbi:PQQ-binding-like beta-propeller repeat protein [Streptomyces sp. CC228A]|uniref:outer membrane protein assembly factor BamB family protein n=1 Tax=Streptomyces sp. CC228A TaxID=2898186 RepID=UPI001F292AC1|nr:PQQ-binding-like beta-propeller repeat protein [Streptomyces sp. CC228A]